jgi:enoyl-CoA hydratase/carnithine racemase
VANEPILFRRENAIATITLNRPDRLNAITWPMIEDILTLARTCATDDAVRVVVLTGAGRAFSSGDDIVDGMGERRMGGDPDGINADRGLHSWRCPSR